MYHEVNVIHDGDGSCNCPYSAVRSVSSNLIYWGDGQLQELDTKQNTGNGSEGI